MPILIRRPDGPYLSQGDERAFFEWLNRIPAVRRVDGVGEELHIHVRSGKIAWRSLRELIALFHRYQGPMAQLAQFENDSNRRQFRDPKAFWFTPVFAKRSVRRRARS
jgi:hypothetical protein